MIKAHFFTIADYEEEEAWLRKQHNKGLRFVKLIFPCFYIFEKCTPEDVIYRLDYKENLEGEDYIQMFGDFGWEYIFSFVGFMYFRKSAAEMNSENDGKIFSDNVSKINMLQRIVRTRLFPILITFLGCTVPCYLNTVGGNVENGGMLFRVLTIVFTVLFILECCLIIYCGIKLARLRKKYEGNR